MTNNDDEIKGTAVEQIAAYATSLNFNDLTHLAMFRAKQVVLDFLGITLGGYQTSLGRKVADFAATVRAGSEATILADGRLSSVEGAAWANAVLSCVVGMSDSHRLAGHVASEVVPVALALGEANHLTGREILIAITAGYDVFGAVQPAVKVAQRERGLDHKGQAGTLASAVVAARAMGLDATKLGHALALAADMACGTEQYTFDAGLCDTEGLIAGFGVNNGIMAARLADFGFRGPPGALDGPYGYFHAFGGGYDPACLSQLGQAFMVASTGFKPHSGCRHVHPCVDATQALLAKERPPLEEITSIEIGTYKGAVTPAFRVNYEPKDVEAAGYSLPVTVSVVLNRGSWYREDIEAYAEPDNRRLWPLVKVYMSEEIEAAYPEKNGCIVTVTAQGGRKYRGQVEYAKGEPENMLTEAELATKFHRLVGNLLPTTQRHRIIEMAYGLDEIDDVSELVRLAAPI